MNSFFNIAHPIKILQTLFQDDDMFDVIQAVLKEITQHLIKYIYDLYQDPRIVDKQRADLETDVTNFFEHIDPHQSTVWTSLGSLLRDQIENIKHSQETKGIQAIDLIICCLRNLFKQDKKERDRRLQRHTGTSAARTKQEDKELRKIQNTLAEITSILLKNFQTLTNNYSQLDCAIPALELLKMMLDNMKQESQPEERSHGSRKKPTPSALEQGVDQFNEFYAELIRQLADREVLRSSSLDLYALREASAILCDI